jgi:magnesium-transporting ATPase (P-type)
VIYLLFSQGLAEILLILLAVALNIPLPLLAVQLLWLNMATNGVQHIGLTMEPAEGGEMSRAPRRPGESILDRRMLEQCLISAAWIGGTAFLIFKVLLNSGMEEAQIRNLILLYLVLMENVHVGNCRSETLSAFKLNPLRNRFLLLGVLAAQGMHLWAMHHPGMSKILGLQPVSLKHWLILAALASSLLPVMELYKAFRRHRPI